MLLEAAGCCDPYLLLQVPQVPANKEEFTFVPCRGVSIPSEAASQYVELMKLMRHQHEVKGASARKSRIWKGLLPISAGQKPQEASCLLWDVGW